MSDSAVVLLLIKTSHVELRDNHDAVAFALHTSLLQSEFTCVALDEQTADSKSEDIGTCPNGWNASNDAYSFVYKTSDSKIYVLKMLRMGPKLLVHGTEKGSDSLHSADFVVADYANVTPRDDNKDDGKTDAQTVEKQLAASYKDLSKLLKVFDTQVKHKMRPPQETADNKSQTQARNPLIDDDPLRDPRFPPQRPGQYPGHPMYPDLGRGDLMPAFPNPGFAPGFGGGGSLMGQRDPYFGRGGRGRGGRGGRPRFDPMHPLGGGEGVPDYDHMRPPGRGPPDWYG